MTNREFRTVEELCESVREIRNRLQAVGAHSEAKELDDTLMTFWTTSSEMIGEIKMSLHRVRTTVVQELGNDSLDLLDSTVIAATALWNS